MWTMACDGFPADAHWRPRLLSLVKRILVAGVVEDGRLMPTEKGVPQGGPTSAVLANVYLHHVLDTWFMEVVKAHCEGEAHLVRYADDFVGCFQYERDARRFYEIWSEGTSSILR